MDVEIKKLDVKKDDRGWLAEILRPEDVKVKGFGQVLVTTANPGKVKGNHYHKRKLEWYSVIQGDMELHLLDLKTKGREVMTIGESNPVLVKINPNIAHAVKCVSKVPAVLLIYISESFDQNDPDTFNEEVIKIPK